MRSVPGAGNGDIPQAGRLFSRKSGYSETRYLKEKANYTDYSGISFNAAVCTFEIAPDGSVKLLEPWGVDHMPIEKVTSNKRSYEEVMAAI